MRVIYETKGRAREYCELAMNLYTGCAHACTYCYAPKATYKAKEDFINPRPRLGVIDALRQEAPRYAGREVLMSFSTDPYQPINEEYFYSRQALFIMAHHGIRPVILTKGGLRSIEDFDILAKCNGKYGATLTYLDPDASLIDEPGAASPQERIEALCRAKRQGIETWVSLEPVMDPDEVLEIIRWTHEFVDEYRVGKLNYDARARGIDWSKFAKCVVETLEHYGKRYYIKKDLAAYL